MPTANLDLHKKCAGKLENRVKVDQRFLSDPVAVFERVAWTL